VGLGFYVQYMKKSIKSTSKRLGIIEERFRIISRYSAKKWAPKNVVFRPFRSTGIVWAREGQVTLLNMRRGRGGGVGWSGLSTNGRCLVDRAGGLLSKVDMVRRTTICVIFSLVMLRVVTSLAKE